MLRTACMVLLLTGSVANAGMVDDQFSKGALGMAWGATLVEVQTKYPHGLTWDTDGSDGTFFAYELHLIENPFGIGDAGVHVHFYFNKEEKLDRIHFMFDYDQRDDALYRVGELIGQDYIPRDIGKERSYKWRATTPVSVVMYVGKTRHYGWVELTLDGREVLKRQEWEAKHFGR